jgi:alpha-glucosidase/alpha-D-xyloside xylohydrolase
MSGVDRRSALKQFWAAGAGLAFGQRTGTRVGDGVNDEVGGLLRAQDGDITIAGKPSEIVVRSISPVTVRITVLSLDSGPTATVPAVGALVDDGFESFGRAVARERRKARLQSIRAGNLVVRFTDGPPTIHVDTNGGQSVQRLTLDAAAPTVTFPMSKGPLLGMGEGGPQFDRKGNVDAMRNGQAGYRLATNGTRAPIQWLIGTDGWAMFIHQPYGAFDFTGADGKFTPGQAAAPLDVFVVSSNDPATIMREYARITGLPEMPAMWTLGYLQSHRTLDGPNEILGVARTMREKKLPCDGLIYLGTEFTPSGWNTRNGEFTWHPTNFPDPKGMLETLHAEHYRVIMHIVIEGRRLTGTVADPCTAAPLPPGRTPDNAWPNDRQVSCYWPAHKPLMDMGVDGWWPDQGDGFDGPSRLNRHRMYWEGTQQLRPNERPFALHRNASAGAQRYGGYIWSGDIQTRWETLATHIPVAINTGLSGLPLWGTDIGGFIPTAEYTGELHVRWFQFGAFCPLFRAHGRNWHLRLPWGWDGGDGGPLEALPFRPAPEELHNAQVEPICRKYMELRYRLMPYLYTVLREAHDTGMPIMRALWLHYPDDATAVARGDEYLWGRDMLVAPVVQKGATSRRLYLPRGSWFDFWTDAKVDGGQEVDRPVDLATMPLYVRAGAIVPMGPVRQYVEEPVDGPLTLTVYPGAEGTFSLYEDDGKSFDYRRGAFMRIDMTWRDAARRLTLRLGTGSRMLAPARRDIEVRVAGSAAIKRVVFDGRQIDVAM